jgi:Tol biopolymer transport system component
MSPDMRRIAIATLAAGLIGGPTIQPASSSAATATRRYLIATVAYDSRGAPAMWTVGTDGRGAQKRVTDIQEQYDGRQVVHGVSGAEWSPDGTRFVYDSMEGFDAPSLDRDLVVYDTRNGKRTKLVARPEGADGAAAWSPDGQTIAWPGKVNNDPNDFAVNLFMRRVSGGTIEQLTGTGRVIGARWSPDATTILFEEYLYDKNGAKNWIKMIDLETRVITTVIEGSAYGGQWSPAGDRIAYTDKGELFIANRDGSSPKRIASGARAAWQWSPDGRLFAAAGNDEAILVVSASGGAVRVIKRPSKNVERSAPAWIPDNRLIMTQKVFTGGSYNSFGIAIMNADGSGQRLIDCCGTDYVGMAVTPRAVGFEPAPASAPKRTQAASKPGATLSPSGYASPSPSVSSEIAAPPVTGAAAHRSSAWRYVVALVAAAAVLGAGVLTVYMRRRSPAG